MIMIKFQMFFFIESFDVLHVIRIISLKWKYCSYCILCVYPLNLCGIMRVLVMPRWIWLCLVGFSYVSYEPMRDYAGFGYASLLFRWIWLCLVVVSLNLVMFRLSLLFRLCSYSWLCIVYYINDTILYKGYCLWFDLVLLIHDPCRRPVMLYIQRKFFK